MEHFLRYSLEHSRPIRGVLLIDGKLSQKNFLVTAMEGEYATLLLNSRKRNLVLPCRDILSCDYARGDRGEE